MLYKIIGEKEEKKIEEFILNENISSERYFSWWEIFAEEESRVQLNEIEFKRFKKLSKKNQKLCLEELTDEIYSSDYVIDGEVIRDLTSEVLDEFEEKEAEEKEKKLKKKKRKKNKDGLKHIKIKRIK